ncbi:pentapeptide repeat-containing protein [Kribbella solani]|uniref:Uncharacterized protein YjbI with pentapeptide repeats n=1 Tax=Kribbella solani TaxID=236067 RepID=A0A841DV59_9ACTN|nr:uncharacterized protein YjbI with pentapeptide repeats [Kribbella solani]
MEDELHPAGTVPTSGKLADFVFTTPQVRHLAMSDGRLLGGRVTGSEAQRVTFDRVRLESLFIEDVSWTSAQLTDCTLSRVVFRRCKLLGTRFVATRFSNVVFEDCRLEYADLDRVVSEGPVVFVRTLVNETTFSDCRFPGGAMTECELKSVTFAGGDYVDFDVRGTDLTTVRGAASLSGTLITPEQRYQLAEALVNELDLRYPEDDA